MPTVQPTARTGNYGPEVDQIKDISRVSVVVPAIVATHTAEVDAIALPGSSVGDYATAEFAAFTVGPPPVAIVVPDGLAIVGARVKVANQLSITFLATIGFAGATFDCFVELSRVGNEDVV